MYAQVAIKPNPLLRNGAYGIVMRGVQKCTRGCSSLRGRNKLPLCCIKLDTATDIDTGGGEFLISLNHPFSKISATEGYPPNVELCKKILLPLGVNFKQANDYANLPFDDGSFDIIINRHGNYDIAELYRLLKNNGIFITEQVGEENERDLVELLIPGTPKKFHGLNLAEQQAKFISNGFSILYSDEAFSTIEFFDVGALVWFAKIIEWEFCGFSVDAHFKNLLNAQRILESNGSIKGTTHRYIIVAKK